MEKAVLFVALVFGAALLGSSQTAPDVAKMRARTVVQDGSGVHLRGAVEVVIGGVRIAADEADIAGPFVGVPPTTPHRIDVRGNVHITAAGPMTVEKR
jgi:hypothetical protein